MNKLYYIFFVGILVFSVNCEEINEVIEKPVEEPVEEPIEEPKLLEIEEQAPKPPNTPAKACERALSLNNTYKPWMCNQYINYCYFNDINKGGGPSYYAAWKKIAQPKTGAVIYGLSTINVYHVGIVCGNNFCDEPNYNHMNIRCRSLDYIMRTFRSYTFHWPPGY